MNRKLFSLLLTIVLAFSCASALAQAPDKDRAGNSISLPEKVERIVSLAPATTQIIMDLGLSDKLVAVDMNAAYYWPELAALPQFDMMAPDTESLAALLPDVVFVSGMSYADGTNPFAQLVQLGVCVVDIPTPSTLEAIGEDVRFTASCLGAEEAGEEMVNAMQSVIDEVIKRAASITEKKTVLFEISALPYIYTCGEGTYLNEMLSMIGAENPFAQDGAWVFVTEEAAVNANPDVILTSTDYLAVPAPEEILSRAGWENVTAVANGDVYYIDTNASNLPNTHITDALLQMAEAVYPEVFKELIAK